MLRIPGKFLVVFLKVVIQPVFVQAADIHAGTGLTQETILAAINTKLSCLLNCCKNIIYFTGGMTMNRHRYIFIFWLRQQNL